MAEWTHRCCERCWFDGTEWLEKRGNSEWQLLDVEPIGVMEGDVYRQPTQVKDVEPGACCVCGGMTITGIFFRRDQSKLRCQGRHELEQLGEWSRVGVSSVDESSSDRPELDPMASHDEIQEGRAARDGGDETAP